MPRPRPPSAETRAHAYAQRTAAREQRLRAHPHADVRGPELVACRLCGQLIKLSTKSAYDAFHWTKHIERCARRAPAGRAQRSKRAAERKQRSQMSRDAVQPLSKRTGLTIRLRANAKGTAPTSTGSSAGDGNDGIYVKEESPDIDIEMHMRDDERSPFSVLAPPSSGSPHASSPGPRSSPPPETPPPAGGATTPGHEADAEVRLEPEPEVREPDGVLEDYYRRSRRRGTRELSPFTLEGARAWTWSQVKEAVWVVRSYPGSHDGEGEGDGERDGEGDEGSGKGGSRGDVEKRDEKDEQVGGDVRLERPRGLEGREVPPIEVE
ncbi:hypothetical protein M0805_004845 [Coniferiporia weirii]|nr:hypothetical protein M0805_004845 [Coniferiporia weirii]